MPDIRGNEATGVAQGQKFKHKRNGLETECGTVLGFVQSNKSRSQDIQGNVKVKSE